MCLAFAGFGVLFFISSLIERENRAAAVSLIFIVLPSCIWAALLISLSENHEIFLLSINSAVTAVTLFLIFPVKNKIKNESSGPVKRYDERDVIFSRARYIPDTELYNKYYKDKPDLEKADMEFRKFPWMAEKDAPQFDKLYSPIVQAEFDFIDQVQPFFEGEISGSLENIDQDRLSAHLKNLACYFGADTAGISKLKPEYVYSNRGRRPETWGKAVPTDHTYALSFAMEMDFDMMKASPKNPALIETARVYAKGTMIAILIAGYLRKLGYSARAQFDTQYDIIAPPAAADAGLGEIGRMSLLMTNKWGPRIRLGAVTTNAPLIQDKPVNLGIQDFCMHCNKCADNCPSGAIPSGEPEIVNGTRRWVIDANKCFTFWRSMGTDCGICMKVCPYSHPYTFIHNMIRTFSACSGRIRRLAVLADDLFYGRDHKVGKFPEWMKYKN